MGTVSALGVIKNNETNNISNLESSDVLLILGDQLLYIELEKKCKFTLDVNVAV